MAISKRKLIIDDITATLQTITTAGGYLTDLGNNVLTNPTSPLVQGDTVGAAIKEQRVDIDEAALSTADGHFCRLQVVVDTFCIGANSKDEIDKPIQDIIKALGVDRKRGGYALSTMIKSYEIDTESADKQVTTAAIDVEIEFSQYQFDLTL